MDKNNWFKKAQYGMMIHFGLYSVLAGEYKGKRMNNCIAEWAQSYFKIPNAEYEKLAKAFNPVYFNADEWTDLAIEVGMKYMVITSKHHEGFALFKSEVDSYNVVDATPFKRDIIKELADSCHKKGLKFGLYYSQALDWHEPHSGGWSEQTETAAGKPWKNTWDFPDEKHDFEICFRRKIVPQVTEILTKYGDIDLIWFDTPADISAEQSRELYGLVKKYQPNCLINSRIGYLPGVKFDYASAGDNEINAEKTEGLFEVPATMNDTWGFKYYDDNWKSPEEIYRIKKMLKQKGINYLLNVGPDHLGRIPAPECEILRKVKALEDADV